MHYLPALSFIIHLFNRVGFYEAWQHRGCWNTKYMHWCSAHQLDIVNNQVDCLGDLELQFGSPMRQTLRERLACSGFIGGGCSTDQYLEGQGRKHTRQRDKRTTETKGLYLYTSKLCSLNAGCPWKIPMTLCKVAFFNRGQFLERVEDSLGYITRSWGNETFSHEEGSRWNNTQSTILRMGPRNCIQVCARSGWCIWPETKCLGGKGKQEKHSLPLITFSQSGIFKFLSRHRYKLKKVLDEIVWNIWLRYQCSNYEMSRDSSQRVVTRIWMVYKGDPLEMER